MKKLQAYNFLSLIVILMFFPSCNRNFNTRTEVEKISVDPSQVQLSTGRDVRVKLEIFHQEVTSLHIVIRHSPELEFVPHGEEFEVRWSNGFINSGRLPVMCVGESSEHNDKYIVFKIEKEEFEFGLFAGLVDTEVISVDIGFSLQALRVADEAIILASAHKKFKIENCSRVNPKPDEAASITIKQ